MGLFERFKRKYAFWTIRYAIPILVTGGILASVGVYYSVRLYGNLRTDLEELLPDSARSVVDLKRVQDRLASTQSLAVLVFSKNTAASRKFITDLSARIPSVLGEDVDRVEYRIDQEVKFFGRNRGLFIDIGDLRRIRNYVRDRIEYEKTIRNPLTIFLSKETPAPVMNFGGLEKKYSDKVSAYTRFKGGYYATPDETIRVALVYLRGPVGVAKATRVTQGVRRLVHELNPDSYGPDMRIRFAGDVEDFVEEHESLINDLAFSTVVVVVLVSAAMLIFYRETLMTLALILSVLMGALWTFGIAYFSVGYLNANSAFLGSIIVGNGINFGIIVLARYLEARRAGKKSHRSIVLAIRLTAMATLTAALAAGLSYGSLASTTFRGFHQFGIIGLIGMTLCWISALSVMPAMIAIIEKYRQRAIPPVRRIGGGLSNAVANLIRLAPRTLLFLSIVALMASVIAVRRHPGQILEADTTKLRDRRSLQSGSAFLSRYLDQIFGRYITPLVILADNPKDMDEIAARIKAYRARTGRASMIAQVYTLHDFIPSDQKKKLMVLREIRKYLKPSVMAQLASPEKRKMDEILPHSELKPFGVKDLPPLVLDRFRLKNGDIGNLVIVEPIVDRVALAKFDNQYRIVAALRDAADSVRPGTPIVGTLPVTVDMLESIKKDGPKATAIAFLSVIVLVAILFRQPSAVGLTLLSLVLGVAWLMGIIFGFDFKINFLNFIALPITFGIGVDYGVNIVQRYRTEGAGKVLDAVRGTGGAVALASLTTIIGYGSLLMAGNQAFFSFGRIAIVGEGMTLSAALLVLPAYLYFRDMRRARAVRRKVEPEIRKAA
ncbi:MAG: MMPL family transporter [Oligoflexia bacterium]|nr:MMPL family transporter [Oligoflexia bacterium]